MAKRNRFLLWQQLQGAVRKAVEEVAQGLSDASRIVSVASSTGTTSGPSTTSATGTYVLADPRLTLRVARGQTALLDAAVSVESTTADIEAQAQLVRSADGGTTWTAIGPVAAFKINDAGAVGHLALSYHDAPSVGLYLYGITIGNTTGADTITAYATHRSLRAVVVEL